MEILEAAEPELTLLYLSNLVRLQYERFWKLIDGFTIGFSYNKHTNVNVTCEIVK